MCINFGEVLDTFCTITAKNKADLERRLAELPTSPTAEVKTESKWAERLAAIVDGDAIASSDATERFGKTAVKCGVRPQCLKGLKAAKLPNTDLDVAVTREFQTSEQNIIEVPFTTVELKRSGIHFDLDQEGENVVAQALHRVAAVIAPLQRDICGNSQPIVVGVVRILTEKPEGFVLSVPQWNLGKAMKVAARNVQCTDRPKLAHLATLLYVLCEALQSSIQARLRKSDDIATMAGNIKGAALLESPMCHLGSPGRRCSQGILLEPCLRLQAFCLENGLRESSLDTISIGEDLFSRDTELLVKVVNVLHSRLVPMEQCWAAIRILQKNEQSWPTWMWSFICPSLTPSLWLAKTRPALDHGRVPQSVWLLAMEKLQGESLTAPPSTVGAMGPVLAWLENLSSCAIVHADLRYCNLMKDQDNQLRLIDYDSLVQVDLAPTRDGLIQDHRRAQHPLALPLSRSNIACVLHAMWQLAMLDWPNRPSSDDSLQEDIAAYLRQGCRKELQLFQWASALESQCQVELTWEELSRAVEAVEAVPQWGHGV